MTFLSCAIYVFFILLGWCCNDIAVAQLEASERNNDNDTMYDYHDNAIDESGYDINSKLHQG